MDSYNNNGRPSCDNGRPEANTQPFDEPVRAYGQGCRDYDDGYSYYQQMHTDRMRRRIDRRPQTNGFGIAGFVLALSSWGFFWLPIGGLLLWILAFVFSIIGMGRSPRVFGIIGFVLCVVELASVVILLLFFGAFFLSFLGLS